MAVVNTIRPNGSAATLGTWPLTGGASHAAVLSDDSDATYTRSPVVGNDGVLTIHFPTHSVPAGFARHAVRHRIRHRQDGASGNVVSTSQLRSQTEISLGTLQHSVTTTPTTQTLPYSSSSSAQLASASPIDFSIIIAFDGAVLSTDELRVLELYIDVDCRAKPVFTIGGYQGAEEILDGGIFNLTNRPRFQFDDINYDGLEARSWSMEIRTPGGALVYSVTGAGKPTSVSPSAANPLPNGVYVATFRIFSNVGSGVAHGSDVVTYNFSVDFVTADSQIVAVDPNCQLGGYIIEVRVGDLPPLPTPQRPAIASATLFGAWDANSLDAVEGLDHGDTVASWSSEGGAKILNSTSSTKPTYVQGGASAESLNGLSGVKFASGQTLRGSIGVVNYPRTFFYVIHTPPHDDNIFNYLTGPGGLGWVQLAAWNTPANQWYFMTHQYTPPHVGFSEAGYHDSPHLFTFVHKGTGSYVRVDQSQKGLANPIMDAGTGTLELGASTNIAGPNAIFYELLVYEGAVSAADIDLIEDYLFTKWFAPLTPAVIPDMTVVRHDLTTGGLTPVRGLTGLDANQTYRIVDYEAPINHEVAYWLYEGGGTEVVEPIGGAFVPSQYLQDACGTDQMYLRWLFDPSVIASEFCLGPIGELTYAPRSGVFPVIGRSDPVVVNDRQETSRGTLRLIGQTTEEVNALRKMLTRDAQPTLLTIPDTYMIGREGQLYFQPLAVKEEWINPDNRIPQHALTVDYVEIAPPALTAPLEPLPVGVEFGNGGWIVWGVDPPDGIPHGDPADTYPDFTTLLNSGQTFEQALHGGE